MVMVMVPELEEDNSPATTLVSSRLLRSAPLGVVWNDERRVKGSILSCVMADLLVLKDGHEEVRYLDSGDCNSTYARLSIWLWWSGG